MNASIGTSTKSLSPEDLGKQIDALRADLATLVANLTNDVSDGVETAGRRIGQTGRDLRTSATTTVLDHPLAAVGIAVGVGLLLGLLARKA